MARLAVGQQSWDIDLVVFDKDGTLIDFHWLWGHKARQAVAAVTRELPDHPQLSARIFSTLGYDPDAGATSADAPLAVAPMAKLSTLVAVVLYQHGLGWHAAEELVERKFTTTLGSVPIADQVRGLGDVRGLFQALRTAGVRIALLTTDDRASTLATLPYLGVDELVDAVMCGDDAVPAKPSAEPLLKLARDLAVSPDRTMMVGDTVCDMMTGLKAAVGSRVGVLTGATERQALEACADLVTDSIHDIRVMAAPT